MFSNIVTAPTRLQEDLSVGASLVVSHICSKSARWGQGGEALCCVCGCMARCVVFCWLVPYSILGGTGAEQLQKNGGNLVYGCYRLPGKVGKCQNNSLPAANEAPGCTHKHTAALKLSQVC